VGLNALERVVDVVGIQREVLKIDVGTAGAFAVSTLTVRLAERGNRWNCSRLKSCSRLLPKTGSNQFLVTKHTSNSRALGLGYQGPRMFPHKRCTQLVIEIVLCYGHIYYPLEHYCRRIACTRCTPLKIVQILPFYFYILTILARLA
jgi:hypothetical protein